MSPSRAPPGDAVLRTRDTMDAISSAQGHKNHREKNELLQLLSMPHVQVSSKFVKVLFYIYFTINFP